MIESNIVKHGYFGIFVAGSRNTVRLNRVEENEGPGIHVAEWVGPGNGNVVARNIALRNGSLGIASFGDHATVDRNQSKFNAEGGFEIGGLNVQVTGNIASQNQTPGFFVNAQSSTFSRNRSDYNASFLQFGGFGIFDVTVGGGTAGTANLYTGNGCTGNAAGNSNPAGLCC